MAPEKKSILWHSQMHLGGYPKAGDCFAGKISPERFDLTPYLSAPAGGAQGRTGCTRENGLADANHF